LLNTDGDCFVAPVESRKVVPPIVSESRAAFVDCGAQSAILVQTKEFRQGEQP